MFHAFTDTFSLVVTGVQCLNLFAGLNEVQAPTAYSKFASKSALSIPSLYGMLVIYTPATCAAAYCVATAGDSNGRERLIAAMLLGHFAKRVAETLFVHRYSGSLDGGVGGFIGTFYALLTLLISAQQAAVPRDAYVDALLPVGLALYAVGEAGNLYHHALLARMRRPPKEQATMLRGMSALALAATPTTAEALAAAPETPKSAYSVPHGGLFGVVAMPHYFFELCAWLGVALVAQQLNALLVFGGMASYLGGRAVATSRWYRAQFGNAWPEGRRHLVPFVF